MLERPKNFQPFMINKEDDPIRVRPLTMEERAELGLEEIDGGKKEPQEAALPLLQASWKNPESQSEHAIEIDFEKECAFFEKMYKDTLGIRVDRDAIRAVWDRNFASMKKEIETYGYDTVVIVPGNLPTDADINERMIETMEDDVEEVDQQGTKKTVKKRVVATKYWIDANSVMTPEKVGYRIILTKGDQNMVGTSDPLLKVTLGKTIVELTGLDESEIADRIQKGDELPIRFTASIGGKDIRIEAEGMSQRDYMIFQRIYFEQTGKHLDENGWTWLPKSRSGARVVSAHWHPVDRQLDVDASDASYRDGYLGLRLSRSFS